MKKFCCIFILVISSQVVSAEIFVGYDQFCGLPVVQGNNLQIASAMTNAYGEKYIHIDHGAMNNWTASRIFVLAHECAHHLLEHTSALGQLERFTGGTRQQELEADCWAAAKLKELGYNNEIDRTILSNVSMGHFSGRGYPSGYERAENISNCVSGGDNWDVDPEFTTEEVCVYIDDVEEFTDYVIEVYVDQVPCEHCWYDTWGNYNCQHVADLVEIPMEVPITRTQIVTKQICE